MKRIFPIFAALALSACMTPGTTASPGLGEVGRVDGLRVRPLQVLEDSRCPMNARCVWAGRLIVRTRVTGGGLDRTLDLELGKPQPIAGGTVALVSAAPEKMAGVEIDPRTYRFTYQFDGGR